MHESTYQCNQGMLCAPVISSGGAERMSSMQSLSAYMLIGSVSQSEYQPRRNELVCQSLFVVPNSFMSLKEKRRIAYISVHMSGELLCYQGVEGRGGGALLRMSNLNSR